MHAQLRWAGYQYPYHTSPHPFLPCPPPHRIHPFPPQFLKTLYLNKCGIPEAGGKALASALSQGNTVLSRLGLANNALGNKTAVVLGELLGTASGLLELDLSWNQIKVGLGLAPAHSISIKCRPPYPRGREARTGA